MNEQNLQLARKWIKGCSRSHPICKEFQPQQSNWRPTRLIHIGSKTQQPRLVTPSKAVSYIALSYCWGTDNTVTLIEATLIPFQNEIPLTSLPNTTRDAITTTRDLGYEYLWVDALCVIQDSKPDWIKESAQMGSIYGSAALTLAAAGIVERITEARCVSNRSTPELEYVAGLWRDDSFQQSLLWRPKAGSSPSRPDYYRAPSWSWASLDGEVDFFEQYIPWIWNGKKTQLARILDVCVEPQTGYSLSTTGQIKSGLIEMECHLRECYLMKTPQSEDSPNTQEDDAYVIISSAEHNNISGNACIEATDLHQQARKFANSCTIDLPEEIPSSQWIQVYCVPLQLGWCQTDRYEQSVWESYEGLILIPHDTEEEDLLTPEGFCVLSQTFRRIGTFTFDLNDDNRQARENELLGSVVFDGEGNWERKRETACII
ncbi:hypothetical protein FNYG_01697 [Fusarium nygamai]|uniref:Heterokaryon incompatibility domain-containing protein n=1 Tax=Gibberella nygamai TaxID=42673 RepID=A0A2K0WRW9_GIBNY|nr:hypothetical protein FNYG_01697 [Fusarium nygamai]